jgi:hypothetical protein
VSLGTVYPWKRNAAQGAPAPVRAGWLHDGHSELAAGELPGPARPMRWGYAAAAAAALVALAVPTLLSPAYLQRWQPRPAVEVLLALHGVPAGPSAGSASAAVPPVALRPTRTHALHATPLWLEAVESDAHVALLRRCLLTLRADSAAAGGVVRSNVGGESLMRHWRRVPS